MDCAVKVAYGDGDADEADEVVGALRRGAVFDHLRHVLQEALEAAHRVDAAEARRERHLYM